MGDFRDELLADVDSIRAEIAGPTGLDVQMHQVQIVVKRWVGERPGSAGGFTKTITDLGRRYNVREVSTREVNASGGKYQVGDVKVGPITPEFPGGGFAPSELAPEPDDARDEILYLLTGPHGGTYSRRALESFRAFSYYLVLTRTRYSAALET